MRSDDAFRPSLPAFATLFSLLWMGGWSLLSSDLALAQATPPPTREEPVREILHGVEIVDPYRWLEDQESPETRRWIDAQNAHTDAQLGSRPGREALEKRFAELLKVDSFNLPTPNRAGDRYFFSRRLANQERSSIVLRRGLGGTDEVLIDPHPWREDHSLSVGISSISEAGHRLAYTVRDSGQDEVEIRVFDVDARKDVGEVLPRARYFGALLSPAGDTLYYSKLTPAGPRVSSHALGTPVTEDRELFGAGLGPEKLLGLQLSEDGRWLCAVVYFGASADVTEVHVNDLTSGRGFQPIVTGIEARFLPEIAGGQLYLLTNWQAPNGRLLKVDLARPEREAWREIVPERSGAVLEASSAAAGRLFLSYLENVQSKVVSVSPEGAQLGEIPFDTPGTVAAVVGRWDAKEVFYGFTSFVVPSQNWRLDVASGQRTIWSKTSVPVATGEMEAKQVWFTSKDGTKVPMFVVHKKGLALTGDHPTLLTGYGGFNLSLSPFFSSMAAAWVERGGVYAVANLRGGGEFGEAWHQAAMQEKKQTTFDDFAAAAEWLIRERYTRPERLAVSGGSNGGLLVGALLTQRPDLVGAVVCSYPLLDMVRYHRFLVAKYWVPEYGSADDEAEFRALLAYSPYHNVKKGTHYPAVLFVTGDGDTRVAPLHARKMAARMQAAAGGERPILLRYHARAGHAGGQATSQDVIDQAEAMRFLLWQLGVEAQAPPAAAR
ncbi:MAG TPA: prolyl oligopeptidase family serine peptidase [Thermoanaerobaculia bacterium]|nr:prolyl oligopeptidase family serine peptidase [Thermoanaerobaculia bacterium]